MGIGEGLEEGQRGMEEEGGMRKTDNEEGEKGTVGGDK